MEKQHIIYGTVGAILAIIIFGTFYNYYQQDKYSFRKNVCEDIGLIKDGFYFEYPPLRDLINETEFKTSGKISSWSFKGKWIGCSGKDNCDYIDCSFPARLCFPSTYENSYCQNIELNLIVDYSLWKEWKNQETGGSFFSSQP